MSWFYLDAPRAAVIAATLLAVAVAARLLRRRWSLVLANAAVEISVVCLLYMLWQIGNHLAHTRTVGAVAHGQWIWNAERTLHIPSEVSAQKLILGHPDVVRATNLYYDTMHMTGMLVFLVWLWLRHRDRYPFWRNVMGLFTGVALLIEMIPIAPPRLLPGTGLVDTAMQYGQSVYAVVGPMASQYAALPSIHVGWALLIGVAVWRSSPSRWRFIGPLHAVLTLYAVVVTANHYWLDGVAASVVLTVAWLLAHPVTRLAKRLHAAAVVPLPEPAPELAPAAAPAAPR